jgi:hypothetical protein
MNFREFLQIEQGTKTSVTGLGAGGRLGQSQATPEMGVTNSPTINAPTGDGNKPPKTIPASAFNVSDKLRAMSKAPFGGMNAGGTKLITPPPSPLSPTGLGSPQPLNAPSPPEGVNPVKVPKPMRP